MEAKDQPKAYFERLQHVLFGVDSNKIAELIEKIASFGKTDKTLFIAGNGGSAGTASHMACDLGKTILDHNRPDNHYRFRVTSLTDSVTMMTALANDFGYEHTFSEQLKNLGREGDMLIVISGSGNSSNIVEAVSVARELGIYTFGLLGFDGGKVKDMLDDKLIVSNNEYTLVEDVHMIISHLITDWFKDKNIQK